MLESDNYLNRTEDRDLGNRPRGSLWSGVLLSDLPDLRSFFFIVKLQKKIKLIGSENQAGESRYFNSGLLIYPFGRCFSWRAFSLLLLSFS